MAALTQTIWLSRSFDIQPMGFLETHTHILSIHIVILIKIKKKLFERQKKKRKASKRRKGEGERNRNMKRVHLNFIDFVLLFWYSFFSSLLSRPDPTIRPTPSSLLFSFVGNEHRILYFSNLFFFFLLLNNFITFFSIRLFSIFSPLWFNRRVSNAVAPQQPGSLAASQSTNAHSRVCTREREPHHQIFRCKNNIFVTYFSIYSEQAQTHTRTMWGVDSRADCVYMQHGAIIRA